MPIIRNPFRKTPLDQCTDETAYNLSPAPGRSSNGAEKQLTASKPLSIRSNSSQPQPTEYQLSEISDSGVFIPPSPPETKSSFWSSRSGTSTRSSSHRSVLNENEPFNISRESFDSYRRSFDISAKSPVLEASSQRSRQSLDARQMRHPSSHSLNSSPKHLAMTSAFVSRPTDYAPDFPPKRPSATPYHPRHLIGLTDKHVNPPTRQPDEPEDQQSPVPDEESDLEPQASTKTTNKGNDASDRFVDVGLGDDAATTKAKRKTQQHQNSPLSTQIAKKPGIFSRFTASSSAVDGSTAIEGPNSRPGSSGVGLGVGASSHGFFGRKRGSSGQGAELGSLNG